MKKKDTQTYVTLEDAIEAAVSLSVLAVIAAKDMEHTPEASERLRAVIRSMWTPEGWDEVMSQNLLRNAEQKTSAIVTFYPEDGGELIEVAGSGTVLTLSEASRGRRAPRHGEYVSFRGRSFVVLYVDKQGQGAKALGLRETKESEEDGQE